MDREYEIFECRSDGSVMWRAAASGLHEAKIKLDHLQLDKSKEYFILNSLTGNIIFDAEVSKVASDRACKCIFQIAYSDDLRRTRAKLLRDLGYAVISAMGNEAAQFLLTTLRRDQSDIALFIIGHDAPSATRMGMIDWLKVNYPTAKILALNPPNQQLPKADFNIPQNGPETGSLLSQKPLRHADLAN